MSKSNIPPQPCVTRGELSIYGAGAERRSNASLESPSCPRIHTFYITSTSFCPRPEGSELSYPKQIERETHSFQCLYDF